MSTTVSYKGQTITTVSNDTKTLLTEGKYLEDDLTLTDVSGGGAVLTTKNISANGTYNASSDSADGYSQVTVAVPASAVDSGTKSISTNGTHDVVGYASANVNVPNSYSASDEGKVVSNGALMAQTSDTVTQNDTYDTTLINSLTVNVSGGASNEDAILSGSISGMYSNHRLITMRQQALRACSALTGVCLPNVTSVGTEALEALTNCTIVDLGPISQMMSRTLQDDASLTTIILRNTSLTKMQNSNALLNTPFKSGGSGGTVYIPKSLYDHLGDGGQSDYKAASNWSLYDGYGTITWAAIEGSQYEDYYADGTPIT